MSLTWEGSFNLEGLTARAAAAVPVGLRTGMEFLKEAAVERTPIEEGTLRAGARVDVDVQDGGNGATGSITYPGPYARYQHEKLSLRHETGQAKYLEVTLLVDGRKAVEITGQAIKAAL